MAQDEERRGWGTGAIYPAKGGFRVAVSLGRDATGRRIRREWQFRTQEAAEAKLEELNRRLRGDLPLEDRRVTVAVYSEEWLEAVRLTVRPSTFGFYSSLARLHLTDLRHLPLDTVTTRDVRRLISIRLAEGYSARTVRGVVDVLRMILKQASVDGLVSRNVAELVTLPPLEQAEPEHLTAEQARRFLAAARDDGLYALFAVALGTGLRVGELTALTWHDVDGCETVRVRRAKTKAGERVVPLPAFASDALREMERRPGRIWPVDRWVPGKRMAGICRRANVPKIGMHGLRHSTASLLYAEGVPEFVIQSILGHTKIGMTRHYTHIEIEQQRDAMDRLGRAVG